MLLRRGGLLAPPDKVGAEPLAGFIYANTKFGAIFVEQSDPLVRRRFSAAHELGHYLLHFRPLFAHGSADQPALLEAMEATPRVEAEPEPDELPAGTITLTRPTDATDLAPAFERMEREANQFAGELLMPAAVIRGFAECNASVFQGEDLVWRLSTEMLVSRAAMRWRLRNLGLPPASGTSRN